VLNQNEFICGGVLVSRHHVITAGHCVRNYTDVNKQPIGMEVHLGRTDRFSEGEPLPMQRRMVTKIHVYPKFNNTELRYDVAVMTLEKAIEYENHIAPICLPQKGDFVSGRTVAFVSGWGLKNTTLKFEKYNETTSTASYQMTRFLQTVDVIVMDAEKCIFWHGVSVIKLQASLLSSVINKYPMYPAPLQWEIAINETRRRLPPLTMSEDRMCAVNHGYRGKKSSCTGDSGGPLMMKGKNYRWSLIGVVSFGFSCDDPLVPAIYHQVASSSDWISSVIRFTL